MLFPGTPLNLAIFHAAAEICEIIVTDPASSSVSVWIDHATDLHKALHSSSPGSNRKDAPSRLLEWIDAGVVYHKNGAVGLLRYAAVLASGGDAHITSTNILVSDCMDMENVVGDSSNESDVNVIETLLGKLVTDKSFDGVALRDSSVAQLITAIRILGLISENAVCVLLFIGVYLLELESGPSIPSIWSNSCWVVLVLLGGLAGVVLALFGL